MLGYILTRGINIVIKMEKRLQAFSSFPTISFIGLICLGHKNIGLFCKEIQKGIIYHPNFFLRYVLNYLRDGGCTLDSLPKDRQLLKELRKEATYYQLHGLLQQIEKVLY